LIIDDSVSSEMIPDYQSIMLPLLRRVADGAEYRSRDLVELLAKDFNLTPDERKELLPSGQQAVFENRVGWAKTYLKKAGLIESPRRAVVVVSEAGKQVLTKSIDAIDVKFLKQFESFNDFHSSGKSETEEEVVVETADLTPEESLDVNYQNIRKSLASELLSRVVAMSPAFFEQLVIELLVKMGYGGSRKDAGKAIGRTNDEGIDGTIKEDKLGLDIIYVQAKRWQPGNTVGRPEIQKFVGALAGQGAKKGIFITTSGFSKEAREYTPRNETKIVLLDGTELTQLMIDYNLGVTTHQVYEVKRLDSDYFGDD
jgi:restriction system protein